MSRAAICRIEGTVSNNNGLSKAITPTTFKASIFLDFEAKSAVV
jgi:hypothetical protein